MVTLQNDFFDFEIIKLRSLTSLPLVSYYIHLINLYTIQLYTVAFSHIIVLCGFHVSHISCMYIAVKCSFIIC